MFGSLSANAPSLGKKEENGTFSPDTRGQRRKDRIPRNLRIVYELGYYYAIFTIQKELPSRKPISKILALDPNHKNLGYGVDTEGAAIEIASPQWLRNLR